MGQVESGICGLARLCYQVLRPVHGSQDERYGELYINASDEELVRQGKRTYGEELTRLYDLDLSGWRVIGHYGCGRGYEGRSWYDMGKPFGRR